MVFDSILETALVLAFDSFFEYGLTDMDEAKERALVEEYLAEFQLEAGTVLFRPLSAFYLNQ
jgi:hypothetical protein